ncbi:MAG: 3-phosphoserine/phosphohydroxythreonine transaminase [Lentisphaeria bacterium]|jgi:phosphoserine aminotransferase
MSDQPPKIFNFHPGPATMPREVMLKAQAEFANFPGLGYGIMEESHRSKTFLKVHEHAIQNVKDLLGIDDSYAVLFLQGGASLQFDMVPMNFALPGKPMLFANTGYWASRAIKEAKLFGEVQLVHDGKDSNYSRIGDPAEWEWRQDAAFGFICSNNTIYGSQYRTYPDTGALPLVGDMSSDIFSRPFNLKKFAIVIAGAQKNLGPSGVTLVILRKDLLSREPANLPTMLKYSTHVANDSMYNTPPTFGIYMIGLVTDWIKAHGGLEGMARLNSAKSQALYNAIDGSGGFYRGTVEAADRSQMNVTYRLPSEELEGKFVKEATATGLIGLKGHRAVGGIRASIYNAMPLEGVERLVDFMHEFQAQNG